MTDDGGGGGDDGGSGDGDDHDATISSEIREAVN